MSTNAENKVIVIRHPVLAGKPQEEVERILFSSEISRYPFEDSSLPPSAWVVGASLKEIYEKVLNKECPYGGYDADCWIKRDLDIHKVVPILVMPWVLRKLNENRDNKTIFDRALQQVLNLPTEVVIEK